MYTFSNSNHYKYQRAIVLLTVGPVRDVSRYCASDVDDYCRDELFRQNNSSRDFLKKLRPFLKHNLTQVRGLIETEITRGKR